MLIELLLMPLGASCDQTARPPRRCLLRRDASSNHEAMTTKLVRPKLEHGVDIVTSEDAPRRARL